MIFKILVTSLITQGDFSCLKMSKDYTFELLTVRILI